MSCIEENLTCQICLMKFNENQNKPVTLVPCGHTYCCTCIEKFLDNLCPYDRQLFQSTVINWLVVGMISSRLQHDVNKNLSNDQFNDQKNSSISYKTDIYSSPSLPIHHINISNDLTPIRLIDTNLFHNSNDEKFIPINTIPKDLIHVGVICDGCNGYVVGKRYRCSTCNDYDLCFNCKMNNVHAETGHSFILFTKPSNIY